MPRRYELKYVCPESMLDVVYGQVLMHPALFSEVFPERIVHNIYLDTDELGNYQDNVSGVSDRLKHRIRWYNESAIARAPVLELKHKSASLGWKESYALPGFVLDEAFVWEDYLGTLDKELIEDEGFAAVRTALKTQKPVLHNHYTRRYYLSADGRCRLTLDRDLIYQHMNGTCSSGWHARDPRIVMELKFDEHDLDDARLIASVFETRMCAHSKYVTGINAVHFLDPLL